MHDEDSVIGASNSDDTPAEKTDEKTDTPPHERDTLIDSPAAGSSVHSSQALAETLRPEGNRSNPPATAKRRDRAKDANRPGLHVRVYGASDVGLVREHNEDNLLVADLSRGLRTLRDGLLQEHAIGAQGSIFGVCDGMGGAAAGEVASQMAVDIIYECMHGAPPPSNRDVFANRLVKAMARAGERIYQEAESNRHRRGMGTTATLAGLIDATLFVAQVGDSRAYLLRNRRLGPITKDQSLVNQLLEAGQLTKEEAEAFEHSNIILQALGTTEEVQIDLTFLVLKRHDRLLLCSDGLSGLVSDHHIEQILNQESDPELVCEKLIRAAHAGGGHDNVTVVVADFFGADLKPALAGEEAAYQQYPLPPDQEREGVPVTRKLQVDRSLSLQHEVLGQQHGRSWPSPGRIVSVGLLGLGLMVAGGVAAWLGSRHPYGDNPSKEAAEASGGASAGKGAILRPEPSITELVEVRVRTDADNALLFVDGERYGELPAKEDLSLLFPPGAYRFEARSDGNIVANRLVTIRRGMSAEVALNLPRGQLGRRPPMAEDNAAAQRPEETPSGEMAPKEEARESQGAPPSAPSAPAPMLPAEPEAAETPSRTAGQEESPALEDPPEQAPQP